MWLWLGIALAATPDGVWSEIADLYESAKLPEGRALVALHLEGDLAPADRARMVCQRGRFGVAFGEYREAVVDLEFSVGAMEGAAVPAKDVGRCWESLGLARERLGAYDEAMAAFVQSSETRADTEPDDGWSLRQEQHRARLTFLLGDHAAGIDAYRHVVARQEEVLGPDHPDVAKTLASIAAVQWKLGQFQEALAASVRSLETLEKSFAPDNPELAFALTNIAVMRRHLGDLAGARRDLMRALPIWEAMDPEHDRTAAALTALGSIDGELGRLRDAEDRLRRALDIRVARQGRDHVQTANAMLNLAVVQRKAGHLSRARQNLERAIGIVENARGPNHPDNVEYYNTLGALLHNIGDHQMATRAYERALEATASDPDHPRRLAVLQNLAQQIQRDGDPARAIEMQTEVLADVSRVYGPESHRAMRTYRARASAHLSLGDFERATADVQRARVLLEKLDVEGPFQWAGLLATEASIAWSAGDIETAMDLRRQEETFRVRDNENPLLLADLRMKLARGALALGDAEEGTRYALSAVEATKKGIDPVVSLMADEERRTFLSIRRRVLGPLLSSPLLTASEAWAPTLAFRGLSTQILIRQAAAARASSDPATAELQSELDEIRHRIAIRARSQDDAELGELTAQKESLERALAGTADAIDVVPTPESLCQSLPAKTALVDIIHYMRQSLGDARFEHRYVAFVTTPSCEPVRVELGAADVIDDAVRGHREVLARGQSAVRADERGRRVRELVWAPLEEALGAARRVWVIPDGTLGSVAFAALPDDAGRYLVEDRTIGLLLSAAEMLREDRATGEGALVIADVDYGVSPAGEREVRPCGVEEVPPLPGTIREADAVASGLIRRLGRLDRVGGTEATVAGSAALASGQRVIHIATHGLFADAACSEWAGQGMVARNPMAFSGLVMAGANALTADTNATDDGVWSGEEVMALDLRGTELVVLSACGTGLGITEAGEGVLGLPRGFAVAGARSVIMSLWSIEDQATSDLMSRMYRRYRPGRDPAVALRRAQLAALAEQRRTGQTRPWEWAGFALSGGAYGPRTSRSGR